MPAHFVDGAVVEKFDVQRGINSPDQFLFRFTLLVHPHHPLGMTIGRRMIRVCQPVLNVVFKSYPPEDMRESEARTLLSLDKLHAIIRQDCMNPVRHGSDQ